METLFANTDLSRIDKIMEMMKITRQPETTFQEFIRIRDEFIKQKEHVIRTIQKMTISEIKKYVSAYGDTKKDRLVKILYEALLGQFHLSEDLICYGMGETYEGVVLRKIYATTENDFEEWKIKKAEKRRAFLKAITNPETLAEFKTFIERHKDGERGLTTEQLERYDELRTGISKERKERDAERKAQIAAVAVGDTDLLIVESFHTKKQIPLWVVKLADRVERTIFDDLKERAHSLGGYWSSYRGQGAIPGFTFTRKDAAELFTLIKDGDVNAIELRRAINAEKTVQRGENVQEKAKNIEATATEELNRDRKTNTARRARMATSAERAAIANIEFSKTLHEIGHRTTNGTIKYLGKLSTIVQLEELYRILSACKWTYISEQPSREEIFDYNSEVIEFAKFPYPVLYKDTSLYILLQKLSTEAGKMMAARRMYKRLVTEKGEFFRVKDGKPLEDYKKLFCYSSRSLKTWETSRYRNDYTRFTRIQKLGFTAIYELRTALRELVEIDQAAEISPEMKRVQEIRELDRKFINLRVPGFFPTPIELAMDLVEKAAIEDGDKVCEPQAGLGHIAEAILEAHPTVDLMCIEQYEPLCGALELKGLNVLHADFLSVTDGAYDRIIMNPPFENLADIDHVLHAWTLLKPKGRLVAVMANNKTGDRKKIRDFMEFVHQYGTCEPNEEGAFRSGFRPTGVSTITVTLDKPLYTK